MANKQAKKVEEKAVQQTRKRGEKGYVMSQSLKVMSTTMGISKTARRVFMGAEIHANNVSRNLGKAARAGMQAENA